MIGYVGLKFARASVLLIAVSFSCFLLLGLAPGDFFLSARLNPQISAATLSALRSQYGLDRPVYIQYVRWLFSIVEGDWGYSLAYQSPAGPLLWTRVANTLLLTITANLASWLIAVPLGVWSAAARNGWMRAAVRTVLSFALALPDLLIVLLLMFAAARLGLLPPGSMSLSTYAGMSSLAKINDIARHLALPAAALTFAMIPPVAAHAQTAMSEALSSTYIEAARGHGISRSRLLFRHALPAASNALISLLGFSIGTLLSASLLVEERWGGPAWAACYSKQPWSAILT